MKLNKKILTLMLVFGVCATAAVAQITVITGDNIKKSEPIDELVFRAQYELKMLEDTTRSDSKPNSETMMLEVGKKSSLFYGYTTYLRDSVLMEDVKNNVSHLSHLQKPSCRKSNNARPYRDYQLPLRGKKRQAAMDSPARYCHYPDLSVPESLLPFPRAQLHGMVHDGNPRQ